MLKFLSLIPQAIEVAKAVETALPISGQGAAKLEFAMSTASAAFDLEQELVASWGDKTKFLAAFEKAIEIVVEFFNKVGVFKKA